MKTIRFFIILGLAITALSTVTPLGSWFAGALGYARREISARVPASAQSERIAALIQTEQTRLDSAAGDLANMKASATAMTASREDLRGEISRLEARLTELEPVVRTAATTCIVRGRSYTRDQVEAEASYALGRLESARQQAADLDQLVASISVQVKQLERAITEGDTRLATLEHQRLALEWRVTASEAVSRTADLANSVATGSSGELTQAMRDFERRAVTEQAKADRRMARADGSPGVIDWDGGEALADRIRNAVPANEVIVKDTTERE